MFVCFQSGWSLARERNIKVIEETISEAVASLNLFNPKSFQIQFRAFLKAPEFQTVCSRKRVCLFVFNLDGLKLENEI